MGWGEGESEMLDIVVIGAGGHAKVVVDILEKTGVYRIKGYIDQHIPQGTLLYGYEVLGAEDVIPQLGDSIAGGVAAIGDNWTRAQVVKRIRAVSPTFRFIQAIHPSAQIAKGVTIGEGSVVMAGAVINSDSHIGDHCIVNTLASIDHDCALGHYASVAPHAVLGGGVTVRDYVAVAIGARVVHAVEIGEHTVIGAGATVLSDIPPYTVAYGTPARLVRRREAGDKYM